ncbi:hypothetical protein LPN04_29800 [Rugamonas sp. A1-17]|nr:hypothetical protein [Rugamonas sp. A1-17]
MLKSHRFLIAATFAALASSMAGCHSSAPPVAYAPASTYAAPAAPVVVQSSGMGDMVAGAAIGSLATTAIMNSNRQGAAAPPPVASTTVNKTVIHKTVIVQAAPTPRAPATPAPVTLAKSSAYPSPMRSTAPPSTPSYAARSSYTPSVTRVSYSMPSTGRK